MINNLHIKHRPAFWFWFKAALLTHNQLTYGLVVYDRKKKKHNQKKKRKMNLICLIYS